MPDGFLEDLAVPGGLGGMVEEEEKEWKNQEDWEDDDEFYNTVDDFFDEMYRDLDDLD